MRFLSMAGFGLLAALPAAADVSPFKTPSGNIECSVGMDFGVETDIACTIHDKNGPPAVPQPRNCFGPWGHHFSMRASGPVTMACGGPGTKNTSSGVPLAPYGETGRFDGITCQSEKTGFQCRNRDGHGFFLSRARQSIW